MTVDFLSDDEFAQLPENKPSPKTDDFWDPVMEAIAERKIVKIPFADEREKKGRRLSVGRRANRMGFPIEIRYGDDFLAVRRANESGDDTSESPPAGRRRKQIRDS